MATVPIALQVWLGHVFLTLRRPPLAIEKSSSSTFGPLATDAALAQNLRRLRERRSLIVRLSDRRALALRYVRSLVHLVSYNMFAAYAAHAKVISRH